MKLFTMMAVVALTASATLAQQYNTNYVDSDYDYQEQQQSQPPPRPNPPQRAYSRPPPAPVRQSGPPAPKATPVPILKQINKHNEDGSYTYGYEGADGSFKIETKLQTGEVMGKYGYVDDVGKVRVVEYGANKYGFQPSGEGITVAPPTLVDDTLRTRGPGDQTQYPEYDDGQYYEQAAPVRPPARANRPQPRPAPRPAPVQQQQQQQFSYDTYQSEQQYSAPSPRPAPRPSPAPVRPSFSNQGPVPPRAQIPGAVPADGSSVTYAAAPRSHPAPVRPAPVHQMPVYHQPPVQQHQAPQYSAPQQSAPQYSRPAPQARQAGGFLDQLARDYALPQGGSPSLTDVSFGFY
uniref:Uncharacterized protein n=2 Tax=Timema TaxID=61471 RepID=A0A7R9FIF4_9NEOP|nr:unnamed protein product [Timema bartmani]CAD7453048.1 unnamed protein product [Timema tahoe]